MVDRYAPLVLVAWIVGCPAPQGMMADVPSTAGARDGSASGGSESDSGVSVEPCDSPQPFAIAVNKDTPACGVGFADDDGSRVDSALAMAACASSADCLVQDPGMDGERAHAVAIATRRDGAATLYLFRYSLLGCVDEEFRAATLQLCEEQHGGPCELECEANNGSCAACCSSQGQPCIDEGDCCDPDAACVEHIGYPPQCESSCTVDAQCSTGCCNNAGRCAPADLFCAEHEPDACSDCLDSCRIPGFPIPSCCTGCGCICDDDCGGPSC